MQRASRVHVVDDDASVRRAVRRLLTARGFAVEVYESSQDFLARRPSGPGCVLLDLQLPDMPGLELLRALVGEDQILRVVILSGHADVIAAVHAMKLGAVDLLTKPVEDRVLCDTVTEACRLSVLASDEARERAGVHRRLEALTTRELEVAWMVTNGFLNKQVAYDLGIAIGTVKGHRGKVMRKLDVQSLADLVRLFGALKAEPPVAIRPFLDAAATQRRSVSSKDW